MTKSLEWRKHNMRNPHDWHNYVTQEVREMWDTFTETQKEALERCFEKNANNEEWD